MVSREMHPFSRISLLSLAATFEEGLAAWAAAPGAVWNAISSAASPYVSFPIICGLPIKTG
jgi:hypothetical protein